MWMFYASSFVFLGLGFSPCQGQNIHIGEGLRACHSEHRVSTTGQLTLSSSTEYKVRKLGPSHDCPVTILLPASQPFYLKVDFALKHEAFLSDFFDYYEPRSVKFYSGQDVSRRGLFAEVTRHSARIGQVFHTTGNVTNVTVVIRFRKQKESDPSQFIPTFTYSLTPIDEGPTAIRTLPPCKRSYCPEDEAVEMDDEQLDTTTVPWVLGSVLGTLAITLVMYVCYAVCKNTYLCSSSDNTEQQNDLRLRSSGYAPPRPAPSLRSETPPPAYEDAIACPKPSTTTDQD